MFLGSAEHLYLRAKTGVIWALGHHFGRKRFHITETPNGSELEEATVASDFDISFLALAEPGGSDSRTQKSSRNRTPGKLLPRKPSHAPQILVNFSRPRRLCFLQSMTATRRQGTGAIPDLQAGVQAVWHDRLLREPLLFTNTKPSRETPPLGSLLGPLGPHARGADTLPAPKWRVNTPSSKGMMRAGCLQTGLRLHVTAATQGLPA